MNHRLVLSFMLTMALLAGCGSNAEIIETWAKHLEAGDYDQAKAMMINPSYDWQESTQNSLNRRAWINHQVLEIPAAEQTPATKNSIRVLWELQGESQEPFRYMCVDVKIKDGKISVLDRPLYCTPAGSYDIDITP